MIWEELNKDLIYLNIDVSNQDELFQLMGSKLIDLDYAKDSYIDALKEREKDFPTGIEIVKDGIAIALPHTAIDHVNKSAISIATLKNPVKFLEMGSIEDRWLNVSLVFMLCVDDPNAHLDQLQKIVQIIQDAKFLDNLFDLDSQDKVIDLFKNKEEELCQKK